MLDQAVRKRLLSDVPLGAFLSGGIDSSSIVALMQRHLDDPVRTFCLAFREETWGEQDYAALVARHVGTNHTEAAVPADRARLRQCLDNLVSNALGYSPRSAPVNVFIEAYNEDGVRWARLEVADEGPGVPQEMIPHIFDRFMSGRTKAGGVGLGLYLANRIAQAHGGRIQVESPPGNGARFILSLPLHRSVAAG